MQPGLFKYYAAGAALKLASLNTITRRMYRALGNFRNAYKPETKIAEKYFFRSGKFLEMLRRHDLLQPGIDVLEIGTGWVHWEALMVRNEVPCQTLLYDVWDNRSFNRFGRYATHLTVPENRARLQLHAPEGLALMQDVAATTDFTAAYERLGFRYMVDPTGLLAGIEAGSRDLIISSDVGEHLNRSDIPAILARTHEILRPGGHAYHQVVLRDHLTIYSGPMHHKQYLSYSDAYYRRYLNNGVQYINQVQVPQWREMFTQAGFDIVEEDHISSCDISEIDVHPDWQHIPERDLACTVVQFLVRRPE